MSRRLRLWVAAALLAVLSAPISPALGAGWSPGERLPAIIVSEVNRQIAGSLRAKHLSWRVPNTIVAREVAIVDPDGKAVALAAELEASVEVKALAQRTLHITRATVRGLRLNLVHDDAGLNIARAFASTKQEVSEDAPLKVIIDRVTSAEANVIYRRGETAVAIAGLAVTAAVSAEGKRYRVVTPVAADRVAIQVGELKVRVDRVKGRRVVVDQDGLETQPLEFRVAELASEIKGTISWRDGGAYGLSGQVSLPAGYWPDGLKRPELRAGALNAAVTLQGALKRPRVGIDLAPLSIEVAGRQLREVQGELRVDRVRVQAPSLRGRFAGGSFEGSASYAYKPRALVAELALKGLRLARLAGREDLDGTVRGALQVRGQLTDPWSMELVLDGFTRQLGAAGVAIKPAHKLHAKARLDAKALELTEASLRGAVVSVTSQGPVRFDPREIALQIDAKIKQPAELHESLVGMEAEALRLRGELRGPFDSARLRGELAAARLEWRELVAEALQARVVVDSSAIEVGQLRAQVAGGALEAATHIALGGARTLRGSAQLRGASVPVLARLSPEQVDGALDLEAELSGTLDQPAARVEARAPALRAQGAGPFAIDVDLLWQGTEIIMQRLGAVDAQGAPVLDGEGRLSLPDRGVVAALQIHPTNLATLPYAEAARIGGAVSGSAQVTGTLELPIVDAALELERVAVSGSPLGDGGAALCARGDLLRASFALGEETSPLVACGDPAAQESARASGWVSYDRARRFIDTRLRVRQVDLSAFTARVPELAGLRGAARGDVRLRGPLEQLEGRASARVDGVTVDAQPVGAVVMNADLAHGVTNVTVDGWGQLRGGGVYDMRDGRRRFEAFLTMSALEPEILSATLRAREARGALNGRIHFIYDPTQTPTYTLDAGLERGLLNLPPAEPIRLVEPTRLRLAGDQLSLSETVLESGGSRVKVGGALRGQALELDVRGELALPILRLLTSEITTAEGLCGVELEVRGTRDQPRLRGEIEPRTGASLTPRSVGRPVEFSGGRLVFSEREIRAEKLRAFGLGGEVWLDGRVDLTEGKITRYDLTGRAANLLLRIPRVRAEVNADLALRGPADAAELSGSVEVVEGRFFERYQLRNFTATASSSTSSISIAELVPSMAATALDVRLTGNDLRAHADMGSVVVQLTGSTNLSVGGSLRDLSLTGAVDVTDGRVQVLESKLDVDTATIDFPPRPDRRVVPNIDLRARSIIEPQASPTGAELPVTLTLTGDIEQMKLDVDSEESGAQISRVDLLTVLATGGSTQALLGETSGDAALRLVSREVFSETERRVERSLDQIARGIGGESIDFTVEVGATSARTGLSWELSRRLQIEAETSISYVDDEEQGTEQSNLNGSSVRSALRARYLLADHLPVVDSVALQADWSDLSFAEDVYSTLDLKLKMRVFER